MQSLLILGRQPVLGIAEVESLYGPEKVQPLAEHAVIVDVDPCLLAFNRLGGTIKFCKLLTRLETAEWRKVERFLVDVSPQQAARMPKGKMQLGLSAIGFSITPEQLNATALTLKKAIRKTGRSVRVTPNKGLELSSAQVHHNGLTNPTGWELQIIRDGEATVIAQTVKVQDIDSYTLRDRGRPKRDTRVGMLPPKLAQIIINLAVGSLPEDKLASICDIPADQPVPQPILDKTILDPFCGTGVILQEALLMGYAAFGTDLEHRMVDYTQKNLDWLATTYKLQTLQYRLEPGDATSHRWTPPVDFVAGETYLGRPFTTVPPAEILSQTISDCTLIIKKFLQNIHGQLTPGTRMCLAVPAWQIKRGQFKSLPLIDQISDLGYNRVDLEHVQDDQLLYFREDQIVARQLLIMTRK